MNPDLQAAIDFIFYLANSFTEHVHLSMQKRENYIKLFHKQV